MAINTMSTSLKFFFLALIIHSLAIEACLHFHASSAKFKILQVADMHYANGATTKCLDVLPSEYPTCTDLNTTAFIKRMIQAENPDLIVYTGDNIFASDCTDPIQSLNAAFAPAVESGIPWAAVLGNHDQESALNREGVMAHIARMKNTLSQFNPSDVTSIDGFGNYNLRVTGAPGSDLLRKSVLNLYFVDSGDYSDDPNISGYGWVKPSQQAWLKNVSATSQRRYKRFPHPQDSAAPALVFFHIPLPEVKIFNTSDILGVKQEEISSPEYNFGFFKSMVDMGDVKAVFNGHDHVNDFCGTLEGIKLCYGGGFGYHAYGQAGWARRARVVEATLERGSSNAKWLGVSKISTWKRLDDDSLSTIDEQVLWTKS